MNMGFFVRPLPRWIAAILVSVLLLLASQSTSLVSAQTEQEPVLTGVLSNVTGSSTATLTFYLTNPDSVSRHGLYALWDGWELWVHDPNDHDGHTRS